MQKKTAFSRWKDTRAKEMRNAVQSLGYLDRESMFFWTLLVSWGLIVGMLSILLAK